MIIRKLEASDAEAFLALLKQLDGETKMMLFEPGERQTTVAKMRERIQAKDIMTFVAVHDHQLVGFLSAEKGFARRIQHSAYIVIGILEAYRSKGIGRQLFNALENWAEEQAIIRLELTVMTHNELAIKLYEKMGFKKEGVKEKSLIVDGEFVDEYYMGKIR